MWEHLRLLYQPLRHKNVPRSNALQESTRTRTRTTWMTNGDLVISVRRGRMLSILGAQSATPAPSGSYSSLQGSSECEGCNARKYDGEGTIDVVIGTNGVAYCQDPKAFLGGKELSRWLLPTIPVAVIIFAGLLIFCSWCLICSRSIQDDKPPPTVAESIY